MDQRLGVPFNTRPSARHRNDFLSVRVSEQKEGGGWELLASRNHARKEEGPFSLQSPTLHMEQYDAEGAVFKEWWGGRLRPTLGFSWRGARLYSEEVFSGRPAQYQRILRTFLHQRLQLSDRLDLIGAPPPRTPAPADWIIIIRRLWLSTSATRIACAWVIPGPPLCPLFSPRPETSA